MDLRGITIRKLKSFKSLILSNNIRMKENVMILSALKAFALILKKLFKTLTFTLPPPSDISFFSSK